MIGATAAPIVTSRQTTKRPSRRIVVLDEQRPAVATTVDSRTYAALRSFEFVLAAESFVFISNGEMDYRTSHHARHSVENTLIAIPPGLRIGHLDVARELCVIDVRDARVTASNQAHCTPFFERRLDAREAERVRDIMHSATQRVADGTFDGDRVRAFKDALLPLFWLGPQRHASGVLRDFLASLWSRLSEPLSIEQLSSEIGYAPTYLCDLMRDLTGRSIVAYITEMRMARARALLEHSDVPVNGIAVRCGYDDPAYFARAFKSAHGVSPVMWRASTRPNTTQYAEAALGFADFASNAAAHATS